MKICVVIGTRPEAIKMAPIILEINKTKGVECIVCSTGQHREMLKQIIDFFDFEVNIDLELMEPNQTLSSFSSKCLAELDKVFRRVQPDIVLVQGDTSSAFIGALAAFNNKIPSAHIEAGLRSFKKYSPYPEEVNRILISKLAELHFTPTTMATANLKNEMTSTDSIFEVGNTVVDACLIGKRINEESNFIIDERFKFLDPDKKTILVTAHRRENHGAPLERICKAINELARQHDNEVQFVYPVHLNPKVQSTVRATIDSEATNIHLTEPLGYSELLLLLSNSYIILTDSGGIQEEATSFGKPILVLREDTERQEGIDQGSAKLVGSDYDEILSEFNSLLVNPSKVESIKKLKNPYGDGNASQKIVKHLLKF